MSKYRINIAGETYEIEVESLDEVAITMEDSTSFIDKKAQTIEPQISSAMMERDNVVQSPMPGTIVKTLVKNGEKVRKGQPILILEAMKMENEITAPKDGVVEELNVAEKYTVQGGDTLFKIMD